MIKQPDNASLPPVDALLDQVADRIADTIITRLDSHRLEFPPALLDRAMLARALRVSKPTIDRLRRDGCPTLWVGGSPRFELDRVLEFLRQNESNGRQRRPRRTPRA